MKKAIFLLSVLIAILLAMPPDPADVEAAQPQDVMAGHWVLKFDDGRTGWANLVSDDYPKTGFSSKGKIEVPGFKKVDITSGVVPESLQGRPGDPVQRPGTAEAIPLRALHDRGEPGHDGLRRDIRRQAIPVQGPQAIRKRRHISGKSDPRSSAGIFLYCFRPPGAPDHRGSPRGNRCHRAVRSRHGFVYARVRIR